MPVSARQDVGEILRSLYPDLKMIAACLLRRERREHTLQRTALVHEIFLRMAGKELKKDLSTQEFLALAAHQMRQVLIDHGRRRSAKKRGGDAARVPLLENALEFSHDEDSWLALEQVLVQLGRLDTRALTVVELKFFAGFTNAEAAAILGVSDGTVEAIWQHARLWLFKQLNVPARHWTRFPLRPLSESSQQA